MQINRRKLFRDAWAYAKAFSVFDRSSPRALFADALRKVWTEAKAIAARLAGSPVGAVPVRRALDIDSAFGWRPRYSRLYAPHNPW